MTIDNYQLSIINYPLHPCTESTPGSPSRRPASCMVLVHFQPEVRDTPA
ncbi:hypothetical protein [[Phormidium] sp. ETS-05]|nr:hypothetical protein [[Phormidium] sp. ETS-05]